MPCNSDYMEASAREKELKRAAGLFVYVLKAQGKALPRGLIAASKDYYCSKDFVSALCAEITDMSGAELDRIVYDAHSSTSRDLADWHEEHAAADRELQKIERANKRAECARQRAIDKLTPEERRAVGLE